MLLNIVFHTQIVLYFVLSGFVFSLTLKGMLNTNCLNDLKSLNCNSDVFHLIFGYFDERGNNSNYIIEK